MLVIEETDFKISARKIGKQQHITTATMKITIKIGTRSPTNHARMEFFPSYVISRSNCVFCNYNCIKASSSSSSDNGKSWWRPDILLEARGISLQGVEFLDEEVLYA